MLFRYIAIVSFKVQQPHVPGDSLIVTKYLKQYYSVIFEDQPVYSCSFFSNVRSCFDWYFLISELKLKSVHYRDQP